LLLSAVYGLLGVTEVAPLILNLVFATLAGGVEEDTQSRVYPQSALHCSSYRYGAAVNGLVVYSRFR
jgi:hypothetical protein